MSKSKQGQYIVKRGDTVESIARKLGMSPYALVSQNPSIRSRRLEQGKAWSIITRLLKALSKMARARLTI